MSSLAKNYKPILWDHLTSETTTTLSEISKTSKESQAWFIFFEEQRDTLVLEGGSSRDVGVSGSPYASRR